MIKKEISFLIIFFLFLNLITVKAKEEKNVLDLKAYFEVYPNGLIRVEESIDFKELKDNNLEFNFRLTDELRGFNLIGIFDENDELLNYNFFKSGNTIYLFLNLENNLNKAKIKFAYFFKPRNNKEIKIVFLLPQNSTINFILGKIDFKKEVEVSNLYCYPNLKGKCDLNFSSSKNSLVFVNNKENLYFEEIILNSKTNYFNSDEEILKSFNFTYNLDFEVREFFLVFLLVFIFVNYLTLLLIDFYLPTINNLKMSKLISLFSYREIPKDIYKSPIVSQYDPPEEIDAFQSWLLLNKNLDFSLYNTLIMDLFVKKKIKIYYDKDGNLILEKIAGLENMPNYYKRFFEFIFKEKEKISYKKIIKMFVNDKNFKEDLISLAIEARKDLENKKIIDNTDFLKNKKRFKKILVIYFLLTILVGIFIYLDFKKYYAFGKALVFPYFILLLFFLGLHFYFLFFARKARKATFKLSEKGKDVLRKLLGYKLFLEKVEKDELEKIYSPSEVKKFNYFPNFFPFVFVFKMDKNWFKKMPNLIIFDPIYDINYSSEQLKSIYENLRVESQEVKNIVKLSKILDFLSRIF